MENKTVPWISFGKLPELRLLGWDYPDGLAAKIPHSLSKGPGFNPWSGKIPYATTEKKERKKSHTPQLKSHMLQQRPSAAKYTYFFKSLGILWNAWLVYYL